MTRTLLCDSNVWVASAVLLRLWKCHRNLGDLQRSAEPVTVGDLSGQRRVHTGCCPQVTESVFPWKNWPKSFISLNSISRW